MMQLFDRVLAGGSRDTLVYLTVIAVGALAAMAGLDVLRAFILNRVGEWLEGALARESFIRAVRAALAARPYNTEVTRDLSLFRGFVTGPAVLMLLDSPWVPVYLFCVFLLHPVLGWIALAGTLVLFALAVAGEFLTAGKFAAGGNHARRAAARIAAAARHPEAIEAMGMMHGVAGKWREVNEEASAAQSAGAAWSGVIAGLSKFVRLGLQVAILGVGAWLVVGQELTGGAMIAASIVMGRALAPVEQAIGAWRQVTAAKGAFSRLQGFFQEPMREETQMKFPDPSGHLRIEDVSLVLPGWNRPLFAGIGFDARPGQVVAITGPSASGKSSLARLLTGVWRPAQGVVRLDGADVTQWNREELGRHVGYLPQTIELYAGTVRENISRFRQASDEEVISAAMLAGAHGMILAMPKGYDTEIGEAGSVLSGGQRQRLALARACFGGPVLVVLDEPDSNLDREGDRALVETILRLKKSGAAVVLIAHRGNLVSIADEILVLQNGTLRRIEKDAGNRQPRPLAVEAQK